MRMRASVAALAAVAMIACGTSDIGNDAEVTVSGQLRLADGSPAASLAVAMVPEPTGLDGLMDIALTVSTAGILCLTKQIPMCKGARKATTDAEGKYGFTLKGEQAKTSLGNPLKVVVVSQAQSGARVEARFEIDKTSMNVPVMQFWEPGSVRVTADPRWVDYSWPAHPKAGGYRFTVTDGDDLVWSQETTPSGRFDARAIEDVRGQFRPIALAKQDAYQLEHHAPAVEVAGAAGPAPSRGRPCSVAARDGRPGPVEPCTLTDGEFGGKFPAQSCAAPSPMPSPSPPQSKCASDTWVWVEPSGQVSIVAVHNLVLSSDVEVESSDDGLKWTRRGKHRRDRFAVITLNPPVKARYIRLRSTKADESVYGLTEVSLWP